jgi:hypothetical protein
LEAVEVPVVDHQHARLQGTKELGHQGSFVSFARAKRRGDGGMRSAFLESDHTNLGKRARFRPVIETAEFGDVLRGIGDVEHESIDRHQSP